MTLSDWLRNLRHGRAQPSPRARDQLEPTPTPGLPSDPRTAFFADDPINSDKEDRIGRIAFAKQIAEICEQVSRQSKTSVMALLGPWGSGKTSLLEMARSELERNSQDWNVVNFNPWLFSDIESLIGNYFSSLNSALPADKGKDARDKLANYAEAIAPLGKLASLAGFDASGITKRAAEILRGDTSVDKRRKSLEKTLESYNQKILVIIDDIDRLQPQELLLIFKLIRLIGRLPNIYYLLAYDEHTVLNALQRSDLVYQSIERAHDYLEKIVQIRLDVPPLHEEYRVSLIDEGLESFFSRFNILISDSDQRRLGWLYHNYLKDDLREPRSINRFIAQLYAMYALVHEEVDVVDFIAMTFLRTFEPGLYRSILLNRDELVGQSLKIAATRSTPEEKEKRWIEVITESGVSVPSRERMLSLIKSLFSNWFSKFHSDLGSVRVVQNGDYFDRYFQFGVPQSDIPDSTVRAAIAQMPGSESDEMKTVVDAMQKNPSRVLRKIDSFATQGELSNPSGILSFLAQQYDLLPERAGFLDSPDILLLIVASEILEKIEEPDAVRALQNAIQERHLRFAADLTVRTLRKSKETGRIFGWTTEIRPLLVETLEGVVHEIGQRPMAEVYELFLLIYRLSWLIDDQEQIRSVLWDNIHSGNWTIKEVLGRLVGEGTTSGGTRTIVELEESRIEELLGIDTVIAELGDILDHEDPSDDDAEDALPTKESKEAYALAVMRGLKRKRLQQ